MSLWLQILLNGLLLAVLILPAIRAYYAGFVKTAFRFFRYVVALLLSLLLASPLGALLKRVWLDRRFYDLICGTLKEKVDLSEGADALITALPVGVRRILAVFRFDLDSLVARLEASGEELLFGFAETVSERVSSIVAVLLAFALVFGASLLVLFLLSHFLNFLFERLAFLEKVNRIFGLLLGLSVGVLCASVVSQLTVAVLTTFTDVDYSAAPLLRFFHDISPLRWIMLWIVRGVK